MFSPHPFLNLHYVVVLGRLYKLTIAHATFQVAFEMLEQSYFFVKFFGLVLQTILLSVVLFLRCPAFHILEDFLLFRNEYDLCRVVKEDSTCSVAQQLPQSIL